MKRWRNLFCSGWSAPAAAIKLIKILFSTFIPTFSFYILYESPICFSAFPISLSVCSLWVFSFLPSFLSIYTWICMYVYTHPGFNWFVVWKCWKQKTEMIAWHMARISEKRNFHIHVWWQWLIQFTAVCFKFDLMKFPFEYLLFNLCCVKVSSWIWICFSAF